MNRNIPSSWQYEHFRQIIAELDKETKANEQTIDETANTKRIVLCLKACEGFTDDDLRGLNLKSKFVAIKQQRDELRDTLEYCRNKIAYMQAHGEWYSPGRAIEMADAAIAKSAANL